MKLSLDTWVIQNWFTGKLFTELEKQFLNSLFDSTEYQIVLSIVNLWEISAREDRQQAIEIGNMLDRLPNKVWIKNAKDLEISEIRYAYRCFKGRPSSPVLPFVKSPVHALELDLNALELRLFTEVKI